MLKIDFARRERIRKGYRILFTLGGLFFMATALFQTWHMEKEAFNYTVNALYFALGTVWLLNGLNLLPALSKRYIQIDETGLHFKLAALKNQQTYLWKDINSLEIKINKLQLHFSDQSSAMVDLGSIPYNDLQTVKKEIIRIAASKHIPCQST